RAHSRPWHSGGARIDSDQRKQGAAAASGAEASFGRHLDRLGRSVWGRRADHHDGWRDWVGGLPTVSPYRGLAQDAAVAGASGGPPRTPPPPPPPPPPP